MTGINNSAAGKIFKNGILTSNPVVIGALGLFPIVSAGTSLKRGVMLSLLMLITMPSVCILTAMFGKLFAKWIRAAFYVIMTSLILVPSAILLSAVLPVPQNFLALFIPLLSVNAIISYRCEKFAVNHRTGKAALDGLANAIGFALVMCLVSAVREIFGSSTVWDIPVLFDRHIDGFLLPFGGFIILGFMSAILKQIIIYSSDKNAPIDLDGGEDID